jgi:NAD(P)-dependent dehydrogenase (short-subunit alcohol dehydrogenase family)
MINSMRPQLEGKISLVTGASRGIGKGIAVGLGEAGATVYLTGRSSAKEPSRLGGTIDETAAEVTRRGGRGIPVRCDHTSDAEVEAGRAARNEGGAA